MKQKTCISMIALLLTLLSLSGCVQNSASESTDIQPAAPLPAEPSPAQAEEQRQAPGFPENIREELETVPDSCMAVLLGEGTFLSEDGEYLMIDQVSKAIYGNPDFTTKASHFAVVDMDYDGAAEIVLRIIRNDCEDGSLVLHDRDGTAYGYYFWFRGFNDLRQDGTYYSSGGAGYYGIGTLTFTEEGYTRNDIIVPISGCGVVGDRAAKVWWYELSEERLAALRELK